MQRFPNASTSSGYFEPMLDSSVSILPLSPQDGPASRSAPMLLRHRRGAGWADRRGFAIESASRYEAPDKILRRAGRLSLTIGGFMLGVLALLVALSHGL